MGLLDRYRMARRGYRSGAPEPVLRTWIAEAARGHSFVDVGCMWKVDGAYAFHALDAGAERVTGVDLLPATEAFTARNSERGNRVTLLRGDLHDPNIDQWLTPHDVVFCSGVLYHTPNPIHTLTQLRRVCGRTLLFATASMPEIGVPHAAVFLPYLDDHERARMNFATSRHLKGGLDTPFDPTRGYANWFWLPTASCLDAMLEYAGFHVDELQRYRRVTIVRASVGTPPPSDLRSPAHRR